ncbi:MAG: MBL fold metallo-hydrolase [Pseudomonadota bacterium]
MNQSTFLIQMDGINILTDPVWSDRASPVSFSGPKRMHPPGIRLEDLPQIDIVLVSHNHYDHLDRATLKQLAEKYNPVVYTPLGNKALLEKLGFSRVIELDWWQQIPATDSLQLTCVPAQHFSGRGILDSYKTLWAGFVIGNNTGAVYFAGDTGFGPHFKQIAQRFNKIRLALLPIGAYRPEWFMSFAHLSPADALKAHFVLEAKTSIAMHFGTFPMADDSQYEPTDALKSALSNASMQQTEFLTLKFGAGRDIAPVKVRSDEY